MTREYFGTDGIRGKANSAPMTADIALKLGMAAGLEFNRGDHRHKVVIAKDTRLSCYMFESALAAGFLAVGVDVLFVGPMPTPAVAMLTRSMRADLGVMISASHNPYEDNGIKLFGPDGSKLSDEREEAIEARMRADMSAGLASSKQMGRAKRIDDVHGRYIEHAKRSFPRHLRLDGLKIVIDCANGAAYKIAPLVLWELGAQVVPLGVSPSGVNINDNCGSMHPERMCDAVVKEGADLGIALDGDADRVLIADETGRLIDGDQLIATIATYWKKNARLRGNTVVATQMSNLALERYLDSQGIGLVRTKVGDRYVLEAMREHDYNLGGEQSGHIILRDYCSSGDGLVSALQVMAVMLERGGRLSEVTRLFAPFPQVLKNVLFKGADPLAQESVQQAIKAVEKELGEAGRVFIRKSGTEAKIRVMLEGEDAALIERHAKALCDVIEKIA